MTVSYGDWQPGHLQLGAPELYVLQHGPGAKAAEVWKLALHELIGRGILKPDTLQQGSGRTTTRTALLQSGSQTVGELSRSLRSIMDAYTRLATQSGNQQGVSVQELANAVRDQHENDLGQWVTDEVVGTLVDRGLYDKEDVKRLGLFKSTTYEPSPEAKAARAALEGSIERAEDQFSTWASDEPTRAATFLAVAGAGVLLIPKIQGSIAKFHGASHGARKTMAAASPETATIADAGFDIYRLEAVRDDLKTLDDAIDYGRLEHDRSSAQK